MPNFIYSDMSKEQSSFIKGLGILLIMVHNFVDILLNIASNEMSFSQKATDAFLAHVFTADSQIGRAHV